MQAGEATSALPANEELLPKVPWLQGPRLQVHCYRNTVARVAGLPSGCRPETEADCVAAKQIYRSTKQPSRSRSKPVEADSTRRSPSLTEASILAHATKQMLSRGVARHRHVSFHLACFVLRASCVSLGSHSCGPEARQRCGAQFAGRAPCVLAWGESHPGPRPPSPPPRSPSPSPPPPEWRARSSAIAPRPARSRPS